jgi:putative addiction module antidote
LNAAHNGGVVAPRPNGKCKAQRKVHVKRLPSDSARDPPRVSIIAGPAFLVRSRPFRYNARMNAPSKLLPLKVIKIGNSMGVVLPKEMLSRLGAQAGDTLNASVDDEGSLTIKRANDDFESQMAVAREVMMRRRRALRELAK